ncbi:MAG: thioredoxin fold domain-containing protein [Muribaculaceae bacterium]|nr:thioredoxin fold domain-containing protein [Muribaculaceae bacterium]
MKKILFCLTALMVLAACNSKSDNNEQQTADNNGAAQSEMPVATPDDEGQGEWIKQTTIMTSKPMVIDFYATWCGPCKQLAPILDQIEQNHKGEVIFKRIDVDQEPELAQEFRVEAIPTLMFVTPKGDYQTIMGLQEAAVIEAKIAELLTRSAK